MADVFVDMGKARADGLDQRATIRVIQYPTLKPIRYQSVTQDWNAAAEHYASVMPPARPPVPLFDERPRSLSGPAVNNLGPTGLGHVRRSIENGRDLDFASVRTSRERKQSIEDSTTRRGDYVMEGTEDDIRNFELTTPIRHNGRPANPSKGGHSDIIPVAVC